MMGIIKELNPIKLVVFGFLIWLVRMVGLFPFLDENGRLPVADAGGHLPENVEYFFSAMIFILTIATLVACYLLFIKSESSSYASQGLVIALALIVVVFVIDVPFAVFLAGRTFGQYFVNVFIDFSPIILIPIFMGLTFDKLET